MQTEGRANARAPPLLPRDRPQSPCKKVATHPLADEDTGVVDRLGEARLEDLGLETALHEVLGLKGEDVVEPHALLVEDTNAHKTADESVTLVEREKRERGRRRVSR